MNASERTSKSRPSGLLPAPPIRKVGQTRLGRSVSISESLDKRVRERMEATPGLTYSRIVQEALVAYLGLKAEQVA